MDGEDYEHDVFISYPRSGDVELWVRQRFVHDFKRALQESLGSSRVFIDDGITSGSDWSRTIGRDLARSRVLVVVLSRQYFCKPWCLAELSSMVARHDVVGWGTAQNPRLLVHAVVARDCLPDHVPSEYGHIQLVDFKEWAYDFDIKDWQINRAYRAALEVLADAVADTASAAPPFRRFPLLTPPAPEPSPYGRPRL